VFLSVGCGSSAAVFFVLETSVAGQIRKQYFSVIPVLISNKSEF
jgi:hypothetical protein